VKKSELNLIVGGDSLIGSALADYWSEMNNLFHSSTRNKGKVSINRPLIDLSDIKTFRQLDKYSSVVICAGITSVEECEKNPEKAAEINVNSTIDLIKKLSLSKTHIVFLSTNHVFDGQNQLERPDSVRNPITQYGRQKAKVEVFIEKQPNTSIIRLTKVIHQDLPLIKDWIIKLSNRDSIYAFKDMMLSPIKIEEVIKKINLIVQKRSKGIFQISGRKDISYYELAQQLAKENGYSPLMVKKDSWKNKLNFTPPNFTNLYRV
jgi:dTDP-4-dehydrorhamnose reductase